MLSPAGDLHGPPCGCTRTGAAPAWSTSCWWRSRCTTSKPTAAAVIKPLLADRYRRRAVPERRRGPGDPGARARPSLRLRRCRLYRRRIEAPGVIRHTGKGARLLFGEPHDSQSWRLETLEAACRGAGIDADALARDRSRGLAQVRVPGTLRRHHLHRPHDDRRGARGPAAVAPLRRHGRGGGGRGAGPRLDLPVDEAKERLAARAQAADRR